MSIDDAGAALAAARAQPAQGAQSGPTGLARDKLGVVAIAFFVVAAAAPMAAVVGASPVLFASVGPATPLVYAIAALLVALFSVGYLRMSQYVTNAGGFVAYIAKGLDHRWATGGAGLAIVCYLSLQFGLWSQYGVFAQSLVNDLFGIDLPPVIWILGTLLAITALITRGVDASLKVLGVLIVGESLIVAILVVSLVADHGWGVFSVKGFTTDNLFSPGLGVALLFAFLCFTTFEATVVFSEEAREPRRTIPRALYLVIAFVGFFYGISTWVIGGAVGIDKVQGVATKDPAGFIFGLAEASAGHATNIAMQTLVVTSFIAMLLGVGNMFARYLFALGRAGVLPAQFSAVTPKGAPASAGIANGLIVGVVLGVSLIAGADPIVTLFAWFSALGTAAFMSILLLASVSIVAFFARNTNETNRWVTVVAPVLSIAAFSYVAYLVLDNYTLLSGTNSTARWLLVSLPVAVIVGFVRGHLKPSIDYHGPAFAPDLPSL